MGIRENAGAVQISAWEDKASLEETENKAKRIRPKSRVNICLGYAWDKVCAFAIFADT